MGCKHGAERLSRSRLGQVRMPGLGTPDKCACCMLQDTADVQYQQACHSRTSCSPLPAVAETAAAACGNLASRSLLPIQLTSSAARAHGLCRAWVAAISAVVSVQVLYGVNQRLIGEDVDSPLATIRPVKCVTVCLVTGDRGLCGGYNSFAIKKVRALRALGTMRGSRCSQRSSAHVRQRHIGSIEGTQAARSQSTGSATCAKKHCHHQHTPGEMLQMSMTPIWDLYSAGRGTHQGAE